MKLFKGLIITVLALAALVVGILFSSRNKVPVEVDLLITQLPPISVAVWILLSFTCGIFISGAVFSVINHTYKHRYQRLLRQVNRVDSKSSESK